MKIIFLLLLVLLLNTALFSEVKNEKYEYSISTKPLRNFATYYNLSLNRYNYKENNEYRVSVSYLNNLHVGGSDDGLYLFEEFDLSIYSIDFKYRKYFSKNKNKGFYASPGISTSLIKLEDRENSFIFNLTNFLSLLFTYTELDSGEYYQDIKIMQFGLTGEFGYSHSWKKIVTGISVSGFIPILQYDYDYSENNNYFAEIFAIFPMINFNIGYIF
ncbi:MAG: hypothetical protein U9N76_07945 [Candidatus Marinimicrobia bacterium]|nr:hypothetical protein [Candidatus Neomarinimicrobiota bacterium]